MAETKRALANVERKMKAAAPFAASAGGEVIKTEMRDRAPKDTSALADSITVQSSGEVAHVGATVTYDRFPHLGTVYQAEQAYGEEGARAGTSGVIAAQLAVYKRAIG